MTDPQSTPATAPANGDYKAKIVDYVKGLRLASDTVVVIFAFAVTVLILWYGIEKAIPKIHAGYDKAAATSKENLETVVKAFEADQDRDSKDRARQMQLIEAMVGQQGRHVGLKVPPPEE